MSDDLDRWVARAAWCQRHRQVLYVSADDWALLARTYNEANEREEAAVRQTDDLIRQLAANYPPTGWDATAVKPRPHIDPDRFEPGSQLHGVEIVLDRHKAERQAKLFDSGVRVIPCVHGPLDGEVEGERLDVPAMRVAGADGRYIPVNDGRVRVGWVWHEG